MPAATLAFGSPNACNLCHTNNDAAWADRQVRAWYTNDYQAATLPLGSLIAAARKRDWSRLPEITRYLSGRDREEIWAASFLHLLRGCDDESKWTGIVPCLEDSSPLVRAAAVEALGDRLNQETATALLAATRDEFRLVRIRAASSLVALPEALVPSADRNALKSAMVELTNSFWAVPDDSAASYNLGNYYMEKRQLPEAVAAFNRAILGQPRGIPSLVNISMAYSLLGSNTLAEQSLRRALSLQPTNAAVNLNLGLLLAEENKLPEAEQALRTAYRADPKSAQAAFNLGILMSKDRPEEALSWCRKAVELHPEKLRYAYTLGFFENQFGQSSAAIATLEKLLERVPPEPDAYSLLADIYSRSGNAAKALSVLRRAADNAKLSQQDRARFRSLMERMSKARSE